MTALIVALALVAVIVLVAKGVGRGRGGGGPEAQLLRMTYGDRGQAERLIAEEQRRTPGMSRADAAARAARRLKRDRSR
jgi:hypothetical protein